jgi:hypothetical protein
VPALPSVVWNLVPSVIVARILHYTLNYLRFERDQPTCHLTVLSHFLKNNRAHVIPIAKMIQVVPNVVAQTLSVYTTMQVGRNCSLFLHLKCVCTCTVSQIGVEQPKSDRPLLCLVMIVKDEAHTVGTTLDEILPYIDCFAILDTGSTVMFVVDYLSQPKKLIDVAFVGWYPTINA